DGAYLVEARLIAADLTSASLIGAELGQAVFYGARFDKTALWGATPPGKEYLAWADLNGALIDEPPSTDLDLIKAFLPTMTERETNSNRAKALQELIGPTKGGHDTIEKGRAWTELLSAFTRDPADQSFRDAVSAIITENAC